MSFDESNKMLSMGSGRDNIGKPNEVRPGGVDSSNNATNKGELREANKEVQKDMTQATNLWRGVTGADKMDSCD